MHKRGGPEGPRTLGYERVLAAVLLAAASSARAETGSTAAPAAVVTAAPMAAAPPVSLAVVLEVRSVASLSAHMQSRARLQALPGWRQLSLQKVMAGSNVYGGQWQGSELALQQALSAVSGLKLVSAEVGLIVLEWVGDEGL